MGRCQVFEINSLRHFVTHLHCFTLSYI